MTDDLRRDREVREWIRSEAPVHAPDRLLDVVRTELGQTRQEATSPVLGRRARLVSRWVAAAAVLVVGVAVVVGTLGSHESITSPGPTPSQSSTASPSPSPSAASPRPSPAGLVLSAGTAASSVFAPGLRFTVPAGWVLREDRPTTLYLSPTDAGFLRQGDATVTFDGINAYSAPLAGPPDGGPTPVAGVGTHAKDLATWVGARPQLLASKPVQTALAGRTAWQLDFRLSPEAGVLCGMPCVNLLNGAKGGYQFGIEGPWQVRAFLLDAPNGTTVMITVEDVDGSGIETELRRARPILDSLTFAP